MDNAVNSFFQALYDEMSGVNPLNPRQIIHEQYVTIEIRPSIYRDAVVLSAIRSLIRGQGHGSRALNWICALADRCGVAIHANLCPFGDQRPRLTLKQLKSWYRKRGFIQKGTETYFVRLPKEQNGPQTQ